MGLAVAFPDSVSLQACLPKTTLDCRHRYVEAMVLSQDHSDSGCRLTAVCQRNSSDKMISLCCDLLSITNWSIFHCASRCLFLQNTVDCANRPTYSLCNLPVSGTCLSECQDLSTVLNGNTRLTTYASHYCCTDAFSSISPRFNYFVYFCTLLP